MTRHYVGLELTPLERMALGALRAWQHGDPSLVDDAAIAEYCAATGQSPKRAVIELGAELAQAGATSWVSYLRIVRGRRLCDSADLRTLKRATPPGELHGQQGVGIGQIQAETAPERGCEGSARPLDAWPRAPRGGH